MPEETKDWKTIKGFLGRGEEKQAKRVFELCLLIAENVGYKKGMEASREIYDDTYNKVK